MFTRTLTRFLLLMSPCLFWIWTLGVAVTHSSTTRESCSDLVQWILHEKPESNPRLLVARFRDHLLSSGTSPAEVERTMPQVWRCAFQDREALRLLWNNVYAGDDPIFLDAPNRLLVEVAEQRSPGAALDVGMGQGRNSIYLALDGWRVTGFDPSDEGIRMARATAARAVSKLRRQWRPTTSLILARSSGISSW